MKRHMIDLHRLLLLLKCLIDDEDDRDMMVRDVEGHYTYHSMTEFRSRMRPLRGRQGLPGLDKGPAQ